MAGAPSFVGEPWGDGMQRLPEARADARRYVENIAALDRRDPGASRGRGSR
jgi:hypothetical protein